jgi:serine/threonine protein kinase
LDKRYKLIETIGEGRYAKFISNLRVKLAFDILTNTFVAVKVMKRELMTNHKRIEQFLKEVIL